MLARDPAGLPAARGALNRMKFTLHPTDITARLVGQEVEVYDFPDGRLEIRWKGLPLVYAVFDQLQRVSHAAIVENKRLSEVLAWIKARQDRLPIPSGDRAGPRRSGQKSGLMKDRVDRLAQAAKSRPKLDRRGRRCSDQKVCAPAPLTDISTLRQPRHFNLVATSRTVLARARPRFVLFW